MRVGRLRKRVTIQSLGTGTDKLGQPNGTWGEFATVWAAIEPSTGTEHYAAEQKNPQITHKVLIRYLPGVTPKMQVKYTDPRTSTSRIFDIQAVIDMEERHKMLELQCLELVGR